MARKLVELRENGKTIYKFVDDDPTIDKRARYLATPYVSYTSSEAKRKEDYVASVVEKAGGKI